MKDDLLRTLAALSPLLLGLLLWVLILLLAGSAHADALDEFIEEQRVEEQDDVSLPSEPGTGDPIDEFIERERCVQHAVEAGLDPVSAEAWCDR